MMLKHNGRIELGERIGIKKRFPKG